MMLAYVRHYNLVTARLTRLFLNCHDQSAEVLAGASSYTAYQTWPSMVFGNTSASTNPARTVQLRIWLAQAHPCKLHTRRAVDLCRFLKNPPGGLSDIKACDVQAGWRC